jgi:peptide/nickel transport system substrate-binding protein
VAGSVWKQGLTRRRVLQGGLAAGALALVGCSGDDDDDATPGTPVVVFESPTPTLVTQSTAGAETESPAETPVALTPTAIPPTITAPSDTLRGMGFVRSAGDSFDPHRAQLGPVQSLHALVFSKVLSYDNQLQGTIVPDLAESLPEQPDETTYVFKLREGLRYHERAPLAGLEVTADDVKFSIERQLGEDKTFRRKSQWVNVQSVEVQDAQTFTVKTLGPLAPLLHYFADTGAFILPAALTESGLTGPEGMVGSGPFMFESWTEGERMRVVRNAQWHGGPSRPYLQAVEIAEAADTVAQEAALRSREVDFGAVWRPMYDALRDDLPGLRGIETGQLAFTGMRFFAAQPPFNDQRLRQALTIALDRQALIEALAFGGAKANAWISWPLEDWALPAGDLRALPGYRYTAPEREADLATANDLYNAAGGPALGTLTLVVADVNEASLGQGSVMRDLLERAIPGLPLDLEVLTYDEIAEGLISGQVQWVSASDSGWLDPDDWLVPFFHSQGNRNSFGYEDAAFDQLLEDQRRELDFEARQAKVWDLERRLTDLALGVNLFANVEYTLAWSYVKDLRMDGEPGFQFLWADAQLDESDANHGRRTA